MRNRVPNLGTDSREMKNFPFIALALAFAFALW